jgi:Zn-finger nucleic acid-binding protein
MPLPCPRDARPLTIQEAEGHIGHLCETCSGLWLPRQYIESLAHLRNFSARPFYAAILEQPKFGSTIGCPTGCGMLQRKSVKGIDLDFCPGCHGIWFDRGEVEALLKDYPHTANGGGSGAGDAAADVADFVLSVLDIFN